MNKCFKFIIATFVLCSLIPGVVFADYTLALNESTTYLGDWGCSIKQYFAQKFTTVGGGSIDWIKVRISKYGSPTGNIYAEIWSDDSGLPDVQVGSDSGTEDISTLASYSDNTDQQFDFSSNVSVSASTVYWGVIQFPGGYGNGCEPNSANFYGANATSPSVVFWTGSAWNTELTGQVSMEIHIIEGGEEPPAGGSASFGSTSTTTLQDDVQIVNAILIFMMSLFLLVFVYFIIFVRIE